MDLQKKRTNPAATFASDHPASWGQSGTIGTKSYVQGVTSLEEMISICKENGAKASLRAADVSNLIPIKGKERKPEPAAEPSRGE